MLCLLACLSLPSLGVTFLCSLEHLGTSNLKNDVTKEENALKKKATGSVAVVPPSEETVKRQGPLGPGGAGPGEPQAQNQGQKG